jgi:hypothetical protein
MSSAWVTGMAHAPNFKLALTRVIVPTGGPAAELTTLEDATRFVDLLRSWRQGQLHWDFAAELLLPGRRDRVVAATHQMARWGGRRGLKGGCDAPRRPGHLPRPSRQAQRAQCRVQQVRPTRLVSPPSADRALRHRRQVVRLVEPWKYNNTLSRRYAQLKTDPADGSSGSS